MIDADGAERQVFQLVLPKDYDPDAPIDPKSVFPEIVRIVERRAVYCFACSEKRSKDGLYEHIVKFVNLYFYGNSVEGTYLCKETDARFQEIRELGEGKGV